MKDYSKRDLKAAALRIFKAALLAADPERAVYSHLRHKGATLRVGEVDYFLARFRRIFVVGAGKASVGMARAAEKILGSRVSRGLVITPRGQAAALERVLVREAGHPLPDEDGQRATEELMEMLEPVGEEDLALFLLSGGASALLTAPWEGISMRDLQRINRLMLASGMTISEINTVRKHLSRVKGGRLAELVSPATLAVLVLSDVIGDRLEVIGSGPTAADPTTYQDAVAALEKAGLWKKAPASVRETLLKGVEGKLPETPKPGHSAFKKVHHLIAASNALSLNAAAREARRIGFNAMVLSSCVFGESRETAKFYAALAREVKARNRPLKRPACFVAGGETTVRVKGPGQGGRCQEMALAAALHLEGLSGVLFFAAGTDGIDGNTDAAGAFADGETLARARRRGLEPEQMLEKNDSYSFFQKLGDLVKTGPTGTNVMDCHLLLVL